MQLSYIGFLMQLCIIYLLFNSAEGVAIRGKNVRKAREREFPFVVAIGYVSNAVVAVSLSNRQFCTGSLITRKHVLTAEHCLLKEQLEHVQILVGSIDLSLCKSYEPEAWMTYQEWKYKNIMKLTSLFHDVAIITLKNCVDDTNVQPGIIPKFKPQDLFGATVKLAGWGTTNDGLRPKVLRTVNMKILTKAVCDFQISQLVRQNTSTYAWKLCTSSDPWASADCGDSGGPLLNERNELIGVISSSCPDDSAVLKAFSPQIVKMHKLLKKKVNLHESLHYYEEFIAYFTKSSEARFCNIL